MYNICLLSTAEATKEPETWIFLFLWTISIFQSYLHCLLNKTHFLDIYTCFTWKHHHVLKIPANLMPSAQVEEEGEWVDMCSSPQEDGNLSTTWRLRTQRVSRMALSHNLWMSRELQECRDTLLWSGELHKEARLSSFPLNKSQQQVGFNWPTFLASWLTKIISSLFNTAL